MTFIGKALTTGLVSSTTDDWATPPELFAGLHHEFHFDLDVAATNFNAKCARYFTADQDGLAQPWAPACCWMNPPYGKSIGQWVAKAWYESTLGALVVGLLPARTDTGWWHDYVEGRAEVRFIRGRLRFGGLPPDHANSRSFHEGSAPFPSAVAIWRPA